MKLINLNNLKILILIILGLVLITQNDLVTNVINPTNVSAVGDLTVDWGIGIGNVGPVFTVDHIVPGESEVRNVVLNNGSNLQRALAVKGVKSEESGNLANVLTISFLQGSTTLYTASLTQFFTDSLNNEGIELLTLNSQEETTLTIEVKFQNEAGNPYQDKTVTFNLVFGIATNIPSACEDIDLKGRFPIYGTDGNDKLYGTAKDDVIIGFAGNDKIYGGSGNDCLVGGLGNDRLEGEADNDIIVGDEGEDKMTGGAGNDVIYSGNGNDNADGESGNDEILGDAGDDNLNGSAGNDMLIGGADKDRVNGSSGKDNCDAEKEISCEL